MRGLLCVFVFSFSLIPILAMAQQAQLKVLSMNFNAEADNTLLFQKRLQLFEQAIQEKNLDLVLIQEGWSVNGVPCFATQVAKDLGMDVAYHFEDGVAGIRASSMAILAKKNLKFHNLQYFKLPHSAITIGNGQSTWVGLGEVNMLMGGQVTLANGTSAFVWTSHLSTNSSADRVDQVQFAFAKMNDAVQAAGQTWDQATIFFGGDLNSDPDSDEMSYLRSLNFQDTWTLSHPNEVGNTYVADPTDPEYNPITRNSGLFPSQYAEGGSARIDYIWTHIPASFSVGVTRTFTSPIQNIWMSDHYALTANFIFGDTTSQNVPSADSEMAGMTTSFSFDDHLEKIPKRKDFVVSSQKGLTMINQTSYHVRIYFDDDKGAVYNSNNAFLLTPGVVSFAFFHDGNFHYRMTITNNNNQTLGLMQGQVRVTLPH